MEESGNLVEMNKDISDKLLESIYLLEILDDLFDGSAKETTILNIIKQHIKTSFNKIEQCREIISISE